MVEQEGFCFGMQIPKKKFLNSSIIVREIQICHCLAKGNFTFSDGPKNGLA